METTTLLSNLLLGGLLGLVGQSIRVIVGLKKTYDASVQTNQQFADVFESRQLFISLLIGFVAGALGILTIMNDQGQLTKTVKEIAIQLITIGYAGTDFIEGFIKKYIPGENNQSGNSTENKARQDDEDKNAADKFDLPVG